MHKRCDINHHFATVYLILIFVNCNNNNSVRLKPPYTASLHASGVCQINNIFHLSYTGLYFPPVPALAISRLTTECPVLSVAICQTSSGSKHSTGAPRVTYLFCKNLVTGGLGEYALRSA